MVKTYLPFYFLNCSYTAFLIMHLKQIVQLLIDKETVLLAFGRILTKVTLRLKTRF